MITSASVLPIGLADLGAFGFLGSRFPLRFFFAISLFLMRKQVLALTLEHQEPKHEGPIRSMNWKVGDGALRA